MIFTSALVVSGALFAVQSPAGPSERERLEVIARRLATQGQLPGLSLAVVRSEKEVLTACAGFADPAAGDPLTPEHFLPAGSIGKTFLGALALHLSAEEGLDLDRPVATWLGERDWFRRLPGSNGFTLRQLLRHESGLEEYYAQPAFRAALTEAGAATTWSPEELTAFVADRPGLFAPGEGWSYADTNYLVAGRAVEAAAGGEFFALVDEHLLQPAGFTGIVPTRRDLPGLTTGFTGAQAMFPFPERMVEEGEMVIDPRFEWTGGGYATRPRDLARWMFRLYRGAILDPEGTRALSADAVVADTGQGHRYALATQIIPTRFGALHGHSGWFPGWVSLAGYLPDQELAVAVQLTTDRTGGLGADPLVAIVEACLEPLVGQEELSER